MKIIKSLKNELFLSALAIVSYCTSLINDFHTDDWRVLSLLRDGLSLNDFLFMDNPGRFRPIVNIILYLRYLIFGMYTPAYYALNIALHVLFCLLLYKLLLKIGLCGRPAFIASALFAVFFPHYEAVLWLYGINRIMGAIVWILSLGMILRYLRESSLKNCAAFAMIYFMGFFVAEDFVVAPIGFILFAILFSPDGERRKNVIFVAISSAIVLITYFILRLLLFGRAGTAEEHYSLSFHIFTKFWEYLQWMVLPPPDHPYFRAISNAINPGAFLIWQGASILATIGLIALLVYAFIKSGKAARFFVLFIFITLLPAMPYDYKVTSRNIYIPSIGLAIVAGILIDRLLARLKRIPLRYLLYCCLIIYMAASIMAIWVTSRTYHKNQMMVAELIGDLKSSSIELNNYPYILFDNLPGRAAIGPALVYHFQFKHDIIASNDPINGPIDIEAAAADLLDKGVSFLVFDYRDGHLIEATSQYITAAMGLEFPVREVKKQ